jgi:hypothetical protein
MSIGSATAFGASSGVVVAHLALDSSWRVAMRAMMNALLGQLM